MPDIDCSLCCCLCRVLVILWSDLSLVCLNSSPLDREYVLYTLYIGDPKTLFIYYSFIHSLYVLHSTPMPLLTQSLLPIPSPLLFWEGVSLPEYQPNLTDHITADLGTSSPNEFRQGSPVKGAGFTSKQQSHEQSQLLLLGNLHEDKAAYLLHMCSGLGSG